LENRRRWQDRTASEGPESREDNSCNPKSTICGTAALKNLASEPKDQADTDSQIVLMIVHAVDEVGQIVVGFKRAQREVPVQSEVQAGRPRSDERTGPDLLERRCRQGLKKRHAKNPDSCARMQEEFPKYDVSTASCGLDQRSPSRLLFCSKNQ